MKKGISRTKAFEEKKLATHAVNIGTKCSHDYQHCSSAAMLRMHLSFKAFGENPFEFGYTIIDPKISERVANDAKRIKKRGLVQLCTVTDAWTPEAQELKLGY